MLVIGKGYSKRTLASFGANGVEFEVQIEADPPPRIIVARDESAEEKKSIWNSRSPNAEDGLSLEEILDYVGKKTVYDIGIKGAGIGRQVAQIVQQYISEEWTPDNFLISSFDVKELQTFKDLVPEVKIGLLIKEENGWLEDCKNLKAYSIHPNRRIVDKFLIERAHENGLKVYVWTVDSVAGVKNAKNIGVDAIITDFPRDALKYI
ncbi:MAG: glycerophosphodiester phosphodiesterase [Minisyncoccales bacterium]